MNNSNNLNTYSKKKIIQKKKKVEGTIQLTELQQPKKLLIKI